MILPSERVAQVEIFAPTESQVTHAQTLFSSVMILWDKEKNFVLSLFRFERFSLHIVREVKAVCYYYYYFFLQRATVRLRFTFSSDFCKQALSRQGLAMVAALRCCAGSDVHP